MKRRLFFGIILACVSAGLLAYGVYAAINIQGNSPGNVGSAPAVTATIACGAGDVACTAGTCSGSSTITCTTTSLDVGDTYTVTLALSNFPGSSAPVSASSTGSALTVTPTSTTVTLTGGAGTTTLTVTGAATGTATVDFTVT